MADTLGTQITAAIGWTLTETLDNSSPTDAGKVSYDASTTDGTAADLADLVWHDTRALAGGANDDLDFNALTNTYFGSTVTFNMVKVKAILIVNTNTVAGDKLRLDSSLANSITGPFGGSTTSKIEVGPDSALLLSSKKDGWACTNGSLDKLRINNPGSNSITYKIVVIGTSA